MQMPRESSLSAKKPPVRLQSREVATVPIDSVLPNPYQPRRIFQDDALEELCASIRQYGLLQPITVRRKIPGQYELIAGERRLRACKMAGLRQIDVIILNAYEQDSAVIAMLENLQRENLHYMEEAEGYANLIRDHNLSQEELARRLGKNQSTIANKIRILRLPDSVKAILVQHGLTERHARALLRIHDATTQIRVARLVAEQGLNVKRTEDLVERTIGHLYGIEKEEKTPRLRPRVRDTRLFVNSIRQMVSQMESAGLSPSLTRDETETAYLFTISIPKK